MGEPIINLIHKIMPIIRELNIVDENDNIIGKDTRSNIHKLGLLHREIHVWFYTSNKEIIFQHRAKDKDTFPDLLDATVGGHVEISDDYETAVIKEILEETGVVAEKNNLHFIDKIRSKAFDQSTGRTNNVIRAIYAYCFKGDLKDLKVEIGKAIGFESWSLEKIFSISPEDKKCFIPTIFKNDNLKIFQQIQKII